MIPVYIDVTMGFTGIRRVTDIMGKKDALARDYMGRKEIFADLANNAIFGGDELIRPEWLTDKDTAGSIAIPMSGKGMLVKQTARDLKRNVFDGSILLYIIGLENQADVHYAMPVKDGLYDFISYADQVNQMRRTHRKEKDLKDKGEFLSGFSKEDRLTPVVTLVLYFGDRPWDGPMTLHEMFAETDSRVLSMVPDYRINLIDPHEIADFGGYRTPLRWLLEAVKCSGSDDELEALFNSNSAYSHLDIDTARMIEAFFDINISSQPEGQEEINMCNAIAQMKEKSHMKGLEEGRMEGREEGRMKGLEEGREEERADLTARLVRSLMTENDSLTEEAAREKAFKMLGLE